MIIMTAKGLRTVLLWVLCLSLPGVLFSQSISARFSTSFYSYERHLSDLESQNHFRLYQTARVTVGRLAGNKLSFHFYGQASQDIAQDADQDPIPRIYNAYFQWREKKGFLQRVRVGRQRMYGGVVYGSIDGVDATFRVGKNVSVGGFAGMLVPVVNEIEIANWDDAHAVGARVSARDIYGAKVLVSFMRRNRRPAGYAELGRFTQRIIAFESVEQTLGGLDVYRTLSPRVNVYGRLDYDFEQERVRRGQVTLNLRATNKLDISAEVMHRAPLVDANSIFSVFDFGTTQDYGLRINYRVDQTWFVNSSVGFVRYETDESVRFGVGVRCKYGSFGYNFRRGYGGQNSGVHAAVNYPLTQKLGLVASTGIARYGLFDENSDKSTSFTGSLGINYRAGKHFSLDVLGQGVNNRFFDSDFRIFVKANYWVFQAR